ncbi:MAG: hypothetical protein KAQ79_06725, partial [Cyclobacteriaceae bacterium]|nr:hypothetical protein [Cyclobacteriaceae bacterium]
MKKSIFLITLISFSLIYGCNPKSEKTTSNTESKQNEVPENPIIKKIADLKKAGYEIVDYHGHLKGGLTMEELLEHSKKTGIDYGVAFNAGLGFPITDDATLLANYEQYKDYPVLLAMQAEGREWVDIFS